MYISNLIPKKILIKMALSVLDEFSSTDELSYEDMKRNLRIKYDVSFSGDKLCSCLVSKTAQDMKLRATTRKDRHNKTYVMFYRDL